LLETFKDKEELERFLNDRVYKDEFWEELCIEASIVTGAKNPLTLEADSFIQAPEKRMIRIPRKEVEKAVRDGRPAQMKAHNRGIKIEEAAPRYLWKPARWAGLLGGELERLPTYLAKYQV
jgi:hypothetical protein